MSCKPVTITGGQPFPKSNRRTVQVNRPLPERLGDKGERVFSYKLTTLSKNGGAFVQGGNAPNYQKDKITLCTCMHWHRATIETGMWVAGFGGKGCGEDNELFYLMKVAAVFDDFAEMWNATPLATRKAKSASSFIYGDLYVPKSRAVADPHDTDCYEEPPVGHKHRQHRSDYTWHKDIDLWRPPNRKRRRRALLRVGIDSGCGGMQGPLFRDGSFEFVPIPDDRKLDDRTYGKTTGRKGKALVEYFPTRRQARYANQPIHVDPEFETYTYGDPTPPKKGLRHLERGDLLVFYAGLEGFDFASAPALYIIGYFEVTLAGLATSFSVAEIATHFASNFHVRHRGLFAQQSNDLVLVKGSKGSRLLTKAHLLSETVTADSKPPVKKMTAKMRQTFGDFGGRHSFQRSPTRWVEADFVEAAAEYVRTLK